jgi:hypothetical protein
MFLVFLRTLFYVYYFCIHAVCDSSVGIATRCGIDGLVIESQCGRNIPHPSMNVLRLTRSPVKWHWGSFLGTKRRLSGDNHQPPPSAEVKERVEIHFYIPS